MKSIIALADGRFACDLAQPLDISIPLRQGAANVNAFHIDAPRFEPFQAGSFVGSVAAGGPCNCENLYINAHGNGTHTECYGHITRKRITINQCLRRFLFDAEIITVEPRALPDGDTIITSELIASALGKRRPEALIIRTTPNTETKLSMCYSGANPTYFHPEAVAAIAEMDIQHLVIDLPSVDKEEDDGALASHHAFWRYPAEPRTESTITEMAYIANAIADGRYLLNLQIASLESDASPSKPVVYALTTAE